MTNSVLVTSQNGDGSRKTLSFNQWLNGGSLFVITFSIFYGNTLHSLTGHETSRSKEPRDLEFGTEVRLVL